MFLRTHNCQLGSAKESFALPISHFNIKNRVFSLMCKFLTEKCHPPEFVPPLQAARVKPFFRWCLPVWGSCRCEDVSSSTDWTSRRSVSSTLQAQRQKQLQTRLLKFKKRHQVKLFVIFVIYFIHHGLEMMNLLITECVHRFRADISYIYVWNSAENRFREKH